MPHRSTRALPLARLLLVLPVVLTVVLGLLAVVGPTAPASASRASESSGKPDPALGRRDCALMGRVHVAAGCSRNRCAVRGEQVRRSPNAETCLVGGRTGAAYGTEIDARTCARLHRRFVAAVNLCAANPHRDRPVTTRAPQCVAPFTTYVVTSSVTGGRATRREAEDRYDVCLRPQQAERLRAQARRTGESLRTLALEQADVRPPGDPGRTVLVVGDSLTWRGTDELGRLRPSWVVDGESGRNLRELGPRLTRFTESHGDPTGLVVALGTNLAPRFGAAELRAVLDRLPEDVPVLLVTPYRQPRVNPRLQVRAVDRIDAVMRQLAADRPLTCLADWRRIASGNPDVLVDGVHQTRAVEGRWARLISSRWSACVPL